MHRRPFPLPWQPHALIVAALLLGALPARAALFTPTKTTDSADGACDADCSLREAVVAANANPGADVIVLAGGDYELTIEGAGEDAGATGDLDVTGDLVLFEEGRAHTLISSGAGDRLIDLHGARLEIVGVTLLVAGVNGNGGLVRNLGGDLTISQAALTGGFAGGPSGFGGAIYSDGTLAVVESTIQGNTASESGGGLAVRGSLELVNSTISGNTAGARFGGGIYFFAGVDGTVANATITRNRAGERGGGVFVESAAFTGGNPDFRNTIIAGNTAPQDPDCSGSADSLGYNLLGVGGGCHDFTTAHDDLVGSAGTPLDPRLAPIDTNGGPTGTHAPLAQSPAIDQGNPAAPGSGGNACEATDQRGAERPGTISARCDIGAFEVTTECVAGGGTLCLENGRFQVSARWETPQGQSGSARAVQLTDDAGYFWFFSEENIEITLKVVNACAVPFNRFWVFLSGLTNVRVDVTVRDTKTGQVKTYTNPQGRPFRTILDTQAFATCP